MDHVKIDVVEPQLAQTGVKGPAERIRRKLAGAEDGNDFSTAGPLPIFGLVLLVVAGLAGVAASSAAATPPLNIAATSATPAPIANDFFMSFSRSNGQMTLG